MMLKLEQTNEFTKNCNALSELNHANQISMHENLMLANQQLQQGFFFQAEQLYRSILLQLPNCHTAAQGVALAALQQNKLTEAISFIQRAIEIAPTVMVYQRNLGELLRRAGQLKAAVGVHTSTILIEPHVAENHYLLGIAYKDNKQLEFAIHHYQKALFYDPNHGFAWNNLGACFEMVGDKEQAKKAYLNAIQLNPQHAEAQNNLAAIYGEEGRVTDARAHFEAAIVAKPDFIEAHYNISLMKTYTFDDPHLAFLETLESKIDDCDLKTRIHYYFAFGKALDDSQQYSRAFQAYALGNQLYHANNPWDKIPFETFVENLSLIFDKSFFKLSQSAPDTRCPIFIVGMPRAGTTLIEQILASHENIYGAGELHILDEIIQQAWQTSALPFSTWVNQLQNDEWITLGKEYLNQTWQLAPDKKFIVDKMPANCFYVGMIYRMLPHAKIIHAMRDPMDSCFSCFTHLFKDSMLFAYDLKTLGDYYVLYAKTMEHWRTTLPATAMFEVQYENMVADYETLSKKIVVYLELPWDPNCLYFYNHNRLVKTASSLQVRKPIYKSSVQRWQHFANHLQSLLDIVAPYRLNLQVLPNA